VRPASGCRSFPALSSAPESSACTLSSAAFATLSIDAAAPPLRLLHACDEVGASASAPAAEKLIADLGEEAEEDEDDQDEEEEEEEEEEEGAEVTEDASSEKSSLRTASHGAAATSLPANRTR
jgi:hypothetical protein